MYTKSFPARVKAVGSAQGLEEGQFRALVSVFGNEDSYGDVVAEGAFTEDLLRWKDSGDPQPVIWAHSWGDAFAHVGRVIEAEETKDGLVVLGQIDDLDTNPTAAQVHRLLKGRRVKNFSFAYDVDEGGWVDVKDHPWGGYYELRKMTVHEVGPCLIGANRDTELLAAKAAQLTRSAKRRTLAPGEITELTKARDALNVVLADTDAKDASQPASGAASGDDPAREPDAPPAEQHGRSAQAAARLTLMTALTGD